jgi:membrane-bound metal-dependent hydrolase YbcI (DUF457 family)
MPFTPYHFGPGGALYVAAPKHVSFIAFCAANVLTDCETGYYLLTNQFPVHRFFHTYVGATVTWPLTLALLTATMWIAARLRVPNFFDWRSLTTERIAIGAALGTYSHVFLDSIMHIDTHPFAPFSDANPTLGLVSVRTLMGFCVACGVVALAVLALRRRRRAPS